MGRKTEIKPKFKFLFSYVGAFAPAGPNTIWKKRYMKDNNETLAYEALMEDSAHCIVPMFYREVEYNSECILNQMTHNVYVTYYNVYPNYAQPVSTVGSRSGQP